MQTLIIVAALGPIHALETLHALLDNHPRGLRKEQCSSERGEREKRFTGAERASGEEQDSDERRKTA